MRDKLTIVLKLCIGALIGLLLLAPLSGCGGAIGLSYGDPYDDRYHDDYYDHYFPSYAYNGMWYGEYVFWQGRWHYHGFDTPYYDPWGWYW